MSKEKEKSFWEDIKDSTKKYFTSSKKKPKKPGKNNIMALYNKMQGFQTCINFDGRQIVQFIL